MVLKHLSAFVKGDSVVGAAFTISNNIIGAGVLFLPFIFKDMGLVFGFIFMVFGCLLICVFNLILYGALNGSRKEDDENPPASIEELVKYSFSGKYTKIICYLLVKICVFLFVFGIIISYQIVLSEMAITTLFLVTGNDFFQKEKIQCRFAVGGTVIVFLCVFSLFKKIRNLRCISFVSISVVCTFFILMLGLYFAGFATPMSSGQILWIPDFSDYHSFIKMVKYGGILGYAHMNLVVSKIHSEFDTKNLRRIPYAVLLSYFIVFSMYVTIAIVGYLSFLDNTEANIILSYQGTSTTQKTVSVFLRFLTFTQLFLTYPVMSYVMTQVGYEIALMAYNSFSSSKKGEKKKGEEKKEKEDEDEGLNDSFDSMSADEEGLYGLGMDEEFEDTDGSLGTSGTETEPSEDTSLEEGGDEKSSEDESFGTSSSSALSVEEEEEVKKIEKENEEKLEKEKKKEGGEGKVEEEKESFLKSIGVDKEFCIFSSVSLFFTIFLGFVAIIYPNAQNVVGYVGGVPGVMFAIVLPCICWMRLVKYKWISAVFVVGLTIFSAVYLGVVSNIIQLLEEFYTL